MKLIDFFKEDDGLPVDERVFNGRPARTDDCSKKPVFNNGVSEEVGGAMPPPAPPAIPGGAPGPILSPGSDAIMPTVINMNAPANPHMPHPARRHGHHPPPPPPPYHHLIRLVSPFGRVIVSKKKKSKKKIKRSKKHPKNPY